MTEKGLFNARKTMQEVAKKGAVHLSSFVSQTHVKELQEVCASLTYKKKEQGHPSGVWESYSIPEAVSEPAKIKIQELQNTIVDFVHESSNLFPELSEWHPTNYSIQKYGHDSGITRHRDGKSNQLLVAVASIQGVAVFETADTRTGHFKNSWLLRPGDLTLLRGAGLDGKEEGLYHAVYGARTSTPRISIGFRQKKA